MPVSKPFLVFEEGNVMLPSYRDVSLMMDVETGMIHDIMENPCYYRNPVDYSKRQPYRETTAKLSISSKMGPERPCLSLPIEKSCLSTSVKPTDPHHICYHCYGKAGKALIPAVKAVRDNNWGLWRSDPRKFYEEIHFLIRHFNMCIAELKFFRWFMLGDIPDYRFLLMANELCGQYPEVMFWMPTLKIKLVERFIRQGNKPVNNFTIRVSSTYINKPVKLSRKLINAGIRRSMVFWRYMPESGTLCTAYLRKTKCPPCWNCWSRDVDLVAYEMHKGGYRSPGRWAPYFEIK